MCETQKEKINLKKIKCNESLVHGQQKIIQSVGQTHAMQNKVKKINRECGFDPSKSEKKFKKHKFL